MPAPALAEVPGQFGYDARSASVAGASVVTGSSPAVVFTNPAQLTAIPSQVSASFLVIRPRVDVTPLPARSGVPRSVYDATLGLETGLETRPLPTAELAVPRGATHLTQTESWLGLGATARLWEGKIALGMLVALPVFGGDRPNVTTHYADEREATFSNRLWPLRLAGWQRVADALAGVAWSPVPWLSMGVSGEVQATAVARLGVYIPDASVQDQVSSTMSTDIATSVRPLFGLTARLAEDAGRWLGLGLTLRTASYFSVQAVSDVTLWNYHESGTAMTQLKRSQQNIPVVFGYQPLELAAGLGGHLGPFDAEITLTYQRWSAYLDQHGQHPEDAARFPAGYEPSRAFDAGQFAFRNVLVPAVGLRWRAAPWLELSAGSSYQPTPAPPQIGRTSYADSDMWGASVGQRILLGDWAIDGALQAWTLVARTTYKDPALIVDEFPDRSRSLQGGGKMSEAEGLQSNNPGFPGYRLSGAAAAASLSVTRVFR